jgi:tRNA pseudouridine13 synthase
MTPFEPPFDTHDLPAAGGEIGPEPEDFRVDEEQLYPWSGQGEHLVVRLKKRGMNTQHMVRLVARAAGVDARDIGVPGQKDRWALTTQWISLPKRSEPVERWELPAEVEVLEVSAHNNKLRTGHLSRNRFELRLVGVESAAAATAVADRLRTAGLANYFGPQRFGRDGGNLDEALRWLRADRRDRGRFDRFKARMWPSVLQSEHFNRFASLRLEAGRDRLLDGEVVRLDGSSRVFVVEDPVAEAPRLATRDIWLTGPMRGGKARQAEREAARLEHEAAVAAGLSDEDLASLDREMDGTRRDLVLLLDDLVLEPAPDEGTASGRAGTNLVLRFSLASGGYATQVAREFCRKPWDRLRRAERTDDRDDVADMGSSEPA